MLVPDKEGTKTLKEAYLDGLGGVLVFVGGIFLFRMLNDVYDRWFASDLKSLPPRK